MAIPTSWKGKELPGVVSGRFGVADMHTLAVARKHGAYATLGPALFDRSQFELIELVKDSGLRGRGGAGFPTGMKWSFVPRGGKPVYLVVNADEGEPGTFKDRLCMDKDPHLLIEGCICTGYALGVRTAYIYVRGEMLPMIRRLNAALKEAYDAGLLGENIQGSGFSLDVYLHRGAGAYICGEETGLIESLEGKRAWPRIKPPFPAVEGAFRKPTVVNNIETMACVTQIARRGADWFKSIGVPPDPKNPRDAGSFGPKLYCLSGHVNKPGCYEAPLGITCRQLIDEYGGGVWKGRKAKAAIPGGISMGLFTEAELDTPLDFNGPGKVGCLGLGTAAVVVMDDQTSMVDFLHNSCRFFAHESCGQ